MTQPSVPSGATRGAVDLTGLQQEAAPAAGGGRGGADNIHVVGTDANFNEIIGRSVRVPSLLVLISKRLPESVVFLGTVIDIARSLQGRVQVVSVDLDSNPGLLQTLRVQSVPVTMGLLQGQAIPMFDGVATEAEVRAIVDQFLQVAVQQGVTGRVEVAAPETPDELPPLHQEAFDAIEKGDYAGARTAYGKALAQNPKDHEAEVGLAQVGLLERTADADLAAAREAAAARPDDVAAQALVADLDLLGGQVEDAFGRLIDLVKRTSGEERTAARDHLVQLFAVIGNADDRVKRARTALMSALF